MLPVGFVTPRLQLRRTGAVPHCSGDGNVSEFRSIHGTAQHQPTAAHVAATNEIRRKPKSVPEILHQDIDILSGCDTAKEDNLAFRSEFGRKPPCVARQWFAIPRIVLVDVDLSKFTQVHEAYLLSGANQPAR